MSASAHIFHPRDNSFKERIRSYRAVLASYRNVEASMQYMGDGEWSERLGTDQELIEAKDIVSNSLKLAGASVTHEEIRQAETQGLLTPDDMKVIIRMERQQEMEAIREEKLASQDQDTQTSSHTFRQ